MSGMKFMFSTGIENSYPSIILPDGTRKRVDEMHKTGHYDQWEKDFMLVNEMGIEYLRYGPPYYSTHLGPGKYNWDFADVTFAKLKELNIGLVIACPTCLLNRYLKAGQKQLLFFYIIKINEFYSLIGIIF